MIVIRPTPFELADTYRKFWAEQQHIAERRIEIPDVLELALGAMAAEMQRRLPLAWQVSLFDALQDAEAAKRGILFKQSQRAGSVNKTDALEAFIIEAVRTDPSIALPQLLDRLQREQQPGGWLEDIDEAEGTIWFRNAAGRSKTAQISGLKDRLSRAKKKVRSENKR